VNAIACMGRTVRIGPAYSMTTRSRSAIDEFTGMVGMIVGVRVNDADVLVESGATLVWVHRDRLESL